MPKPKSSGPVEIGHVGTTLIFNHKECGHIWKPRENNQRPTRCPKCNNLLVYREEA